MSMNTDAAYVLGGHLYMPQNPAKGELYFDGDTRRTFLYSGLAWVPVSNVPATPVSVAAAHCSYCKSKLVFDSMGCCTSCGAPSQ